MNCCQPKFWGCKLITSKYHLLRPLSLLRRPRWSCTAEVFTQIRFPRVSWTLLDVVAFGRGVGENTDSNMNIRPELEMAKTAFGFHGFCAAVSCEREKPLANAVLLFC